MKKAFSLIELIIVIIVIGILYSSVNYSLSDTSLNQAANQLIYNINYTRHLAINDNKMQYYPINNSKTEMNRSKYWFKQWWQIRFSTFQDSNNKTHYWYEIFTDVPYSSSSSNFDGQANLPITAWQISIAKNPLNYKLMIGHCATGSNYPNCNQIDNKLDLTEKYGIKKIKFSDFSSNSPRLVFDNNGNVFLREGDDGDAGDINPYDKDERKPLLKTAKITLCKDKNCEKNISICITPKIGTVYLCK